MELERARYLLNIDKIIYEIFGETKITDKKFDSKGNPVYHAEFSDTISTEKFQPLSLRDPKTTKYQK